MNTRKLLLNHEAFSTYMGFVKKIVYGFLMISLFFYIDRLLFSVGMDLASLDIGGYLILSAALLVFLKVAIIFYKYFNRLYTAIQNKVSNILLEYVFDINRFK